MKRNGLFGPILLTVVVCDVLALLLWACGEAVHHGWDAWQGKALSQEAKNGEEGHSPTIFFEGSEQDPIPGRFQ